MGNEVTIFSREVRNVFISREFVLHKLKCSQGHYPHLLAERFPHVLERIIKLWHSPECVDYINDLLKPNGSGGRHQREGFPEKAWDEIYMLLLHYEKSSLKLRSQVEVPADLQIFSFLTSFVNLLTKDKNKHR